MWRTLHTSANLDADFAKSADELVRTTFRNLIWATGSAYLVWHLVATVSWSQRLGVPTWGVTACMGLVIGLTMWQLPRHIHTAQWCWHLGLLGVITAALCFYRQPEIAFLFVLLPFMASVTMSWYAGIVIEILASSLAATLAYALPQPLIPFSYAISIVIMGGFTVLIGWSSSHALYTVTHWLVYSYNQARENMEKAREHRGQLARVVKDLDQAYHRLERANAALVAAWRAADDAARFKAEFIANVSHELRTPLNLIVGFSEMITTAPESYGGVPIPGPYRSDLNAIYHNARHLLALVDDVLDLARIEAGKIALARDWVDLPALIQEAIDMVRDYIAAKGLTLQMQIEPGLPELSLDRMRIRQVLLNLLVNAARFTERGTIRVEAAQQNGEVVLRISDTGRGIPKEDLPKIFEEFRSTEQPVSTWHSGTGLGLPISKKFVELHHGRMGVESIYLQGTTFWFTIPCDGGQTEIGRMMRAHPTRRMGASEKIIVTVHEDPRVAPLLQRYLDGYRVIGAEDAAEGIALVEDVKALALIVDSAQTLPDLPSRIPIIRCPLPSGQRAAISVGAEDLLVKPVSRAELVAAMERLNRPVQRVLIADDDPDVVRLFRRMLRNRVQECLEAHNGREALEMIEAHTPDLVILDLVMPEVDGQEVLAHLSRNPRLSQIPVLLVTARGQDFASVQISGPIQISREQGFQLGETVQILGALFGALAPGW